MCHSGLYQNVRIPVSERDKQEKAEFPQSLGLSGIQMRGHMRILNHFTFQRKGKDHDLIGLYNQ